MCIDEQQEEDAAWKNTYDLLNSVYDATEKTLERNKLLNTPVN